MSTTLVRYNFIRRNFGNNSKFRTYIKKHIAIDFRREHFAGNSPKLFNKEFNEKLGRRVIYGLS